MPGGFYGDAGTVYGLLQVLQVGSQLVILSGDGLDVADDLVALLGVLGVDLA